MAADICILDIRELAGGLCNIRFCLWFSSTPPYPMSGYNSAYSEITTDPTLGPPPGADYDNKLKAGSVTEEVYSMLVPSATVTGNWSVVQSHLLAILNARKAYKAGTAPAIPAVGLKYKILHDSVSGWTA